MAYGVVEGVVGVHAQEAATLFETRAALLRAPHANLASLGRLDDRLAAHLDALAVAGEHAQPFLDAELADRSIGSTFAFAVRALESGRADALNRLWTASGEVSPVRDGLLTAFGWVNRRLLQGVVRDLLASKNETHRAAGVAVCAMHRTDPGLRGGPWLTDASPTVRARALRAAGELGLADLALECERAVADVDADCRFWAAWSAVLLGRRGPAMNALARTALSDDAPHRARAFRLTLQAMDTSSAHAMLQDLARDPVQRRWLIEGSGIAGDATYVPWLIGQMAKPDTARLAGEAFTLITGADLDALQLWQQRPEDVVSGPTEGPEDEDVALDPDEGLMWPDVKKVETWWAANGKSFQAGQRYFMGKPVTREHCIDVLKHGYQRQRILAAHYLCLLNQGTPLFNTSAPAWRQQKLLTRMP